MSPETPARPGDEVAPAHLVPMVAGSGRVAHLFDVSRLGWYTGRADQRRSCCGAVRIERATAVTGQMVTCRRCLDHVARHPGLGEPGWSKHSRCKNPAKCRSCTFNRDTERAQEAMDLIDDVLHPGVRAEVFVWLYSVIDAIADEQPFDPADPWSTLLRGRHSFRIRWKHGESMWTLDRGRDERWKLALRSNLPRSTRDAALAQALAYAELGVYADPIFANLHAIDRYDVDMTTLVGHHLDQQPRPTS